MKYLQHNRQGFFFIKKFKKCMLWEDGDEPKSSEQGHDL